MKLEGNEIISINDYDILYSYYDCWKCTAERLNAVFQGIVEADGQMENGIKHRVNASDKANNAKDQTVASIYDNGFCIPLSIAEKCFDIWGILKMASVKSVGSSNNFFGVNHIIRCRSKFLPLGFSKFVLVLIL